MGQDREFEGRDLKHALNLASEELGIAEPDLDYKIVEQGRKGLFGLGAKTTVIRVMPPLEEEGGGRRRRSRRDRPERRPRPQAAAATSEEPTESGGEEQPREIRHDELRGLDSRRGERRSDKGEGGGGGGGGRGRGGRGRGRGRGRGGRDGEGEGTGTREGRGGRRRRGGRGRGRDGEGGREKRDSRGGRGGQRRGNKPRREPAPKVDVTEEDRAKVEETARKMFELMQFELEINGQITDTGVLLQCEGDDTQLLTQKKGEALSAVRFLLNRMGRRAWPEAGRVQLSCNGHGEERDEELVELVREVISQVRTSGKPKKLHPMNSYERRLAHLEVRNTEGVDSHSEGEGELRQVVIVPADDESEDDDGDTALAAAGVAGAFDMDDDGFGDDGEGRLGSSLLADADTIPLDRVSKKADEAAMDDDADDDEEPVDEDDDD